MGRRPSDWFSRKPVLAVAGLAGGFLAGTPYAVFNWPRFLDHMGSLTTISSPLTEPAARFAVMFAYSFEWTCPGFVDGYGLGFQALCGSCLLS